MLSMKRSSSIVLKSNGQMPGRRAFSPAGLHPLQDAKKNCSCICQQLDMKTVFEPASPKVPSCFCCGFPCFGNDTYPNDRDIFGKAVLLDSHVFVEVGGGLSL